MRVLRFGDLKAKGICGSRATLHRLRETDPSFPQGIAINGGIGWIEAEVDQWIAKRPRIAWRAQPTTIAATKAAQAAAL
jgi:predicted DNA-binding transcriptional regulator AlpA